MNVRNLEEFKQSLDKALEQSHSGNLQVKLSDKCIMHYAIVEKSHESENSEIVDEINFSFHFHSAHIDAILEKDEERETFDILYAEGELIESFESFIEDDDVYKLLEYTWSKIEENYNK